MEHTPANVMFYFYDLFVILFLKAPGNQNEFILHFLCTVKTPTMSTLIYKPTHIQAHPKMLSNLYKLRAYSCSLRYSIVCIFHCLHIPLFTKLKPQKLVASGTISILKVLISFPLFQLNKC